VRGGVLRIAQRHAGVQGCGDERVSQRVRPGRLTDLRAAGGPADDPRGAVPVQPTAIGSQEQRPVAALADGQVDRPRRPWCERDGDDLAAFARDDHGGVAALDTYGLDVDTGGFGDRQPIAGQQRDERMLGGPAEPGGDQQRASVGDCRAALMAGAARTAGSRWWMSRHHPMTISPLLMAGRATWFHLASVTARAAFASPI
jgi:hypothetical protein